MQFIDFFRILLIKIKEFKTMHKNDNMIRKIKEKKKMKRRENLNAINRVV